MRLSFAVAVGMTSLGSVLFGGDALACGGTFCDRPAPGARPMPVDQSGENVLFAIEGGFVEVHVQIQYTGAPERFAWIVPMPAAPEVSVGSEQLFVNLLNATVPQFTLNTQFENCSSSGGGSTGGCTYSSGSADDEGSFEFDPERESASAPAEVDVDRRTVGSFEVSVIRARSSAEILAWLDENGFLSDQSAVPLVDDYVAREHVFVAVKLRPGAGTNQIHPLVFRYAGNEPCIPIKLTAVAATNDMGVRAFFLGARQVVPTNYAHVVLNDAAFDWTQLGTDYRSVVTRAVDMRGSNGRGFVTEYAGTSAIVGKDRLDNPGWRQEEFVDIDPTLVVRRLEAVGLMDCRNPLTCDAKNGMLPGLLEKYLPPPPGMSPGTFYSCLECVQEQIDRDAWDGAAFAAELDETIFEPARHAAELLRKHSYLTRLFTTISPIEMTEDPLFREVDAADAGEVSSTFEATQTFTCSGQSVVSLESGREVVLDGASWPSLSGMPAAERVESYSLPGRDVVFDGTSAIEEILEKNARALRPSIQNDEDDDSRMRSGSSCSLPSSSGSGHAVWAWFFVAAAIRRLSRRRRRA